MTDEFLPPDRSAFYNTFGRHSVLSAIDAIDDSVAEHTGTRCDEALRGEIESIIRETWYEWAEILQPPYPNPPGDPASGDRHFQAAARICNALTDALGEDVDAVNMLGASIAQEVLRALLNLTEALAHIYRDALLDMGFKPDDPRFKGGQSYYPRCRATSARVTGLTSTLPTADFLVCGDLQLQFQVDDRDFREREPQALSDDLLVLLRQPV